MAGLLGTALLQEHATPEQTSFHGKSLLYRRPHTKSRNGCFTCKSRRIKCGEELPICRNCIFRKASCKYPPAKHAVKHTTNPGRPNNIIDLVDVPNLAQPSSANAIFTAREMSFFHHFLTSVSHPLPLGNGSIWLKEIPQIAHDHRYLMHAILAWGASEFQRSNPEMHAEHEVLQHRGRAITGLNKALDDADAWASTGFPDAVLATCYALIFQSSHIVDGMQDYEILVRGSALITERIRETKPKTFLNVTQDWPREKIQVGMQEIESRWTDRSLIKQGLQALERLDECLEMRKDHSFWVAMHETLTAFLDSPVQGYRASMLSYGQWYSIADGLLQALSDPDQSSAVILSATFIANMILIKLLVPLQVRPTKSRSSIPSKLLKEMSDWVDAMDRTVHDRKRQLLDFPKSIIEMVSEYLFQESEETSTVELDAKVDILLKRQTKAHMILGDIVRLGSELTTWFEDFCVQLISPSET